MNPVVKTFSQMKFDGNIIPLAWFQHPDMRLAAGKVNLPALILLADIVYWYRPAEERDDKNRVIGIKQKFQRDRLQMRYAEWAEKFGLTERQCKDSCAFLKRKGLIVIELRDLAVGPRTYRNTTFFEPVPAKILTLNEAVPYVPDIEKGDTSKRVTRSNVPRSHDETGEGHTFKRASTETSLTETTGTEINTPRSFHSPPDRGGAETKPSSEILEGERADSIRRNAVRALEIYKVLRIAWTGKEGRGGKKLRDELGLVLLNWQRDEERFMRALERFFGSKDEYVADGFHPRFFYEDPAQWDDGPTTEQTPEEIESMDDPWADEWADDTKGKHDDHEQ